MATCPRIDPLRPFTPDRQLPGMLLYGATCVAGTMKADGSCVNTFTVAVPWSDVTGPGGLPAPGGGTTRAWTAPGGNRYWSNAAPGIKADVRNPTAKAILRLMAARSKMHTDNVFKNWDDYKNLTMAQVLAKTRGKLATSYGIVHVEIAPDPNETAKHFASRGGYLLWIDPTTGAFTGHQPIDWYKPSWLPADVDTIQLWGNYNIAAGTIEYSLRVRYEGNFEKVVRVSAGFIQKAMDKFCAGVTDEKVMALAVAAKYYPSPDVQVYTKAYMAAVAVCGARAATAITTAEACTLAPGQPPPATPTFDPIAIGNWKATMAQVGQVIAPQTLALPPAPTTVATVYPEGTIAWYDASVNLYRVAGPQPGDGTTHAALAPQMKLPPGVIVVSKTQWEKATLPFWRRGTTKIGVMIVGVAAAITATVYVGASNR